VTEVMEHLFSKRSRKSRAHPGLPSLPTGTLTRVWGGGSTGES
jgi:hypothetical protein